MRAILAVLCLSFAGCIEPDPQTVVQSALLDHAPCLQDIAPTTTSTLKVAHYTVPLAFVGDGAQCGGGYHTIGATCICSGDHPTPTFLDVNAFVPTYRCGTCPSGLPTLILVCLQGATDLLDPNDYLNGVRWGS